MNWQKLNAGLAAAVSDQPNGTFFVFIRFNLPLDNDDWKLLSRLGITKIHPSKIATASLNLQAIEELSDQPFVQMISPVGKFKALNRQRHQGSVWIDNNRITLPNNEWVAADKDGLVAVDPSIEGLNLKLKELGVKTEDVCIAFITLDSV